MGLKPLKLEPQEMRNRNPNAEWACDKIMQAINRKQWVDITIRIENGKCINVNRAFKEVYSK